MCSSDLIAVDFSNEMLTAARTKINSEKVTFIQADINQPWVFANRQFDLIVFSLVLEHIENLDPIFKNAANILPLGGQIYVGELHPFKQYLGSKARFETENDVQILTCFNHNVSDFIQSAFKYGFEILNFNEYFDDDDKEKTPRILTILFKKIKNE